MMASAMASTLSHTALQTSRWRDATITAAGPASLAVTRPAVVPAAFVVTVSDHGVLCLLLE